MFKLLYLLKDYKKETVLGPLFKLLEATFELIIPIIMATIIDKGIISKDKNYIINMCLVMTLMGIIGLVCSITAQFFAAKAAVGFSTKLRVKLFEYIQGVSYSELDEIGVSTLITRMTSDINQIQTGINLVIRLFLRSPFIVVGAMIMAFKINVRAALIFVVVIPLLFIIVFAIMFLSIPLYKKVQSGLDKILLAVRENLAGVRVIRAINYEAEEIKKFREVNSDLTKLQLHVGKISALMNPITYAVINLGIVAILNEGAIQVNSGIITTGEVVALVNYMSQILVELIKLANLIVTVNKSVASGNRIQEVFEIQVTQEKDIYSLICNNTNNKKKSLDKVKNITFKNVCLKYNKAKGESLSNVTFEINSGETIGIIGGTGSGKTSLVNLIPRYYDVTTGNLDINEKNIREYDLLSLRKEICTVPQKSVMFKGSIRENIKVGKQNVSEEEIIEKLKMAQAYDFVMKKKGELDFEIEQGGKNLSGGQKQRLAIARALVTDASVIIFDDSMSALDYATDVALRNELKKIKDKIKIIVTQRVATLTTSDKIVVLDDGEVAGIGSHKELMESCEVYKEIYYSQVKMD